MQNGIEEKRIRNYCKAFYAAHLAAHFKSEEEKLFPLLGPDNQLVHTALLEHRRIEKYIHQDSLGLKGLSRLEELLDKHIRFEERKVFPAIQEKLGDTVLNTLHFPEDAERGEMKWPDAFWEK